MKFHSTTPSPRFCATIWSLAGHPTPATEWTLDEKITAIAEAGFDGIHDSLSPDQIDRARDHGLVVIGRLDARFAQSWQDSLMTQIDHGVSLFNTHLGLHSTSPREAASTAAAMFERGQQHGARVQFETHRDTATETPEKYNELRTRFEALTGHPLPTTWDHSHFAVMKHILPCDYSRRLLAWPTEICASQLFHCRPFNGQHAQIPVTNGTDQLTPECVDYLRFIRNLFQLWLQGPTPRPQLWICPELGASEGYHLSTNPPPWPEAIRCARELKKTWNGIFQQFSRIAPPESP